MNSNKSPFTDKKKFRAWCQEMQLDSHQVADVLGIGMSKVYQCLDETKKVPIREMISLNCELINDMNKDEQAKWIQQQLKKSKNQRPWPSPIPIKA
jgi:hypothetical protein